MMNGTNSTPKHIAVEVSIREHESMNGSFSRPAVPSPPPRASVPSNGQDCSVINDSNGDLPSRHVSTQPSAPMSSPRRQTFSREERIDENGSFRPQNAPVRNADGLYSRPRGRCPIGFEWDHHLGLYMEKESAASQTSDSSHGAGGDNNSNASSNAGANLASYADTSMNNGVGEQHLDNTPPVSSTATYSGSTLPSNTNSCENGQKHFTRLTGSGNKSSRRKSENGCQSGVSLLRFMWTECVKRNQRSSKVIVWIEPSCCMIITHSHSYCQYFRHYRRKWWWKRMAQHQSPSTSVHRYWLESTKSLTVAPYFKMPLLFWNE